MTEQRSDWDTAGRAVVSTGLIYGAVSAAGLVAIGVVGPIPAVLLLEAAAFVAAIVVLIVAMIWMGVLRKLAKEQGHDPREVAHGGLSLWAVTLVLSSLLVPAGLLMDDMLHPALLITRMSLRVVGALALILGVRVTRSRLKDLLSGRPAPKPEARTAEPTVADWDASTLDDAARDHLERKRKIYYD